MKATHTRIDPTVKGNIELFKFLMQKLLHRLRNEPKHHTLSITALVHKKTGEIRFPELSYDRQEDHTQWKPISIQLRKPDKDASSEASIFLEILPEKEEMGAFVYSDLEPKAKSQMIETLKTLNLVCGQFKGIRDVLGIIKILSALQVDSLDSLFSEKDIIHEAWHAVSREEAEALLLPCKEGTFLFRKDPYAALLEKTLSEAWGDRVKCLTLSYLWKEGQVKDKTILLHEGKWLIYNDDPNLRGEHCSSIFELLSTLEDRLTAPLLHEEKTEVSAKQAPRS